MKENNTDTKLYGPNEQVQDQIDNESNVSTEERRLLDESENNGGDEDDAELAHASLDTTDEDGEPLNEKGFGDDHSGKDLDIPGEDDDDADEEIGEEDEENNDYSESDTE